MPSVVQHAVVRLFNLLEIRPCYFDVSKLCSLLTYLSCHHARTAHTTPFGEGAPGGTDLQHLLKEKKKNIYLFDMSILCTCSPWTPYTFDLRLNPCSYSPKRQLVF